VKFIPLKAELKRGTQVKLVGSMEQQENRSLTLGLRKFIMEPSASNAELGGDHLA